MTGIEMLMLHVARTQQADGMLLARVACGVEMLLEESCSEVDPALAEAIKESARHHDKLKAALDKANETP